MANPTTNYSFAMPTNTDLVKDLPADFEVFGQAVDTQMKTNADLVIPKTIVDAKGDLIAATAADTVARLAVGTNDQVLTADSTAATGMKWAGVPSGGMTLLSTTTLSGASVVVSSINQTYNSLYIVIKNYIPADDNRSLSFRFNNDSTADRTMAITTFGITQGAFSGTEIGIFNSADNAVSQSLGIIQIFDYANTTTWKLATVLSATTDSTTPTSVNRGFRYGIYNQTSAISSLGFFPNAGNMTSGTVLIYGVK